MQAHYRGGVIPPEWGWATIIIISLIAFAAALYPGVRRWRAKQGYSSGRPTSTLWRTLYLFYRLPSAFWSALDMIFAMPLALAAGVGWSSRWARYAHFLALMLCAILFGLYSEPGIGLPAVLVGVAIIIAVNRRWSWVERDRERFTIERGKRKQAELAGFKQDLTDEALIGLIFLFVLIPLALAQTYAWTCAANDCAFGFKKAADALPEDPLDALTTWIGFFGAELFKAAPFVDWSEVFEVANDSPIEATSPFGKQVVFVTRAALDLLLLASVLQAVQIAGRLQGQRESF